MNFNLVKTLERKGITLGEFLKIFAAMSLLSGVVIFLTVGAVLSL